LLIARVTRKQSPAFCRTIEHYVQCVGRWFAGEDGQENATAKDRINEPGASPAIIQRSPVSCVLR